MRPVEVTGTYKLPYVVKPEWSSYLILTLLFGPFVIMCLSLALFKDASFWQGVILSSAYLLFIWLTIGSNKISLLDDRIVCKSLISGWSLFARMEMPYREMARAEVVYGTRGRPGPALALYNGVGERAALINIKPFSRRDLAIVGEVLSAKAPQAQKIDTFGVIWPRQSRR